MIVNNNNIVINIIFNLKNLILIRKYNDCKHIALKCEYFIKIIDK